MIMRWKITLDFATQNVLKYYLLSESSFDRSRHHNNFYDLTNLSNLMNNFFAVAHDGAA